MRLRKKPLIPRILGIIGSTLLLVLVMAYPFLPGRHDALAVTASTMVQVFGVIGLLMVPPAVLWVAYEWRKRLRIRRDLSYKTAAFRFALLTLVASVIPMLAVIVVALSSVGLMLALPTLAMWLGILAKMILKLKSLKYAEPTGFNFTPVYVAVIPLVLSLSQLLLAGPLTGFSRNRAMTNSAEFIQAIGTHRERYSHYPESLLALWPDYSTGIVGIAQYHYARRGDAYNVFFEQPRFFFDNFGTREFVVYNKLNQHLIASHTGWILEWSPERLAGNPGCGMRFRTQQSRIGNLFGLINQVETKIHAF